MEAAVVECDLDGERGMSRRQKTDRVPLWARAFLRVDRAVSFCVRMVGVVRDEILLAWLSPEQLDLLSGEYYGRSPDFLPGGSVFRQGLFAWERDAVTSPPFPASGRILIGAVGGGRELNELCRMGYAVAAFEPSRVLAKAAREVAGSYPGAAVVQATYRDLVRTAEGAPGPLRQMLDGQPIDAVILGWGSISHVIYRKDRLDLLIATRRIAPAAPVLVSYLALDPLPRGRSEAFRFRLRSFLRGQISRGGPSGQVTHFSGGAFVHRFEPGELEGLALDAGYEVAAISVRPYPHAVLVPRVADAGGTGRSLA
jgi:hypothetical protein